MGIRAKMIVNASHYTQVRPTPNLHFAVELSGQSQIINSQEHLEVLLADGEKQWVDKAWLEYEPHFDVEGLGVVTADNGSLMQFMHTLDERNPSRKLKDMKVGESLTAHFQSGMGHSHLRVTRIV